jgi:hypothetical protein
MSEPDLFTVPAFSGETYDAKQDHGRLAAQLVRVRTLMLDGQFRTLAEITAVTGDPQASVSARLRDLRKEDHGLYIVARRRRSKGTFEYAITGQQQAKAA